MRKARDDHAALLAAPAKPTCCHNSCDNLAASVVVFGHDRYFGQDLICLFRFGHRGCSLAQGTARGWSTGSESQGQSQGQDSQGEEIIDAFLVDDDVSDAEVGLMPQSVVNYPLWQWIIAF